MLQISKGAIVKIVIYSYPNIYSVSIVKYYNKSKNDAENRRKLTK